MADRTIMALERPAKPSKGSKKTAANNEQRERVFDAFRRWGYLEATLDPLGLLEPLKNPDLDGLTGEAADEARRVYCGTIGADFTHLPEPERRQHRSKRPKRGDEDGQGPGQTGGPGTAIGLRDPG